ncbi:MAG: flagellar basal body-associated FliL family protein [Steroidobacteraceae bacterium]
MAEAIAAVEPEPTPVRAPPAAAKPGVGGMIVQGLGLTLVVAVGTLAGQFLYQLVGHAGPAGHEAPAGDGKAAPESAAPAEPAAPPVYHAFEPLIVNFDENGELRFLQVTVEVMARDPKTIAAIEANTPVLRNDLLLLVGSSDMKALLTREGKEQLRAQALKEVQTTMARLSPGSKVEDLYFTGFVMQ